MAAADFIDAIGAARWKARLGELRATAGGSDRVARALARKHAIEVALVEGPRTPDVGGKAKTSDLGRAIAEAL